MLCSPFWISWPLKMGPIGCPKVLVRKSADVTRQFGHAGLGLTPQGLVFHKQISDDHTYLSAKFRGKNTHFAFEQIQ